MTTTRTVLPTWSDADITAALPLAVLRRDMARERGQVDTVTAQQAWIDRLLDALHERGQA